MSPQRFDELPDLDHFICPAAVPVIAIPFAFRRTEMVLTAARTRLPFSWQSLT
jgi:hypothetical protein